MLKSDLRNVNVGDWVLNLQQGWEEVIRISEWKTTTYPIETTQNTYTYDGYYEEHDKYPSVFVDPPPELIMFYGPEPKPFVKGNKVLCDDYHRRYYSHTFDGQHWCYRDGQDPWSSKGELEAWPLELVEKWEEEDE